MVKNDSIGSALTDHTATAKRLNLSVSPRHCVELSNCLRYKSTQAAKQILDGVIQLRRPIAFLRFNQDTGHKAGMAAGRYPQKAAREFLRLIEQVEANAQVKGLDVSRLKIIKLVSNKASIPLTGKRIRHRTKRSHLEIAVAEHKYKAGKSTSPKTEKKEKQHREKKP